MFQLPLKYLYRLLSDFVIITLLLTIYLNFSHIWGPITQRGFFCNDESLLYPFHMDTISHGILYFISLAIPVIVVITAALLEYFILNSRPKGNGLRCLITVNDTVLPFLFGFAAERLLKEIGKYSLGRLRPYFFDICQPILSDGTTCADPENYNVYIEHYRCQMDFIEDKMDKAIVEKVMRTSFPSAHTSLAFYGMVFTIYALQRFSKCLRRYRPNFGLFVPMFQLLCMLLAWFVAISRILDYKHHWSDVLAGGVLGTSVAIAVAYYVHGQLRSVARLLEAMELPTRPPRPTVRGDNSIEEGSIVDDNGGGVVAAPAAAVSTMSVVSTQVSDISRSEIDGDGDAVAVGLGAIPVGVGVGAVGHVNNVDVNGDDANASTKVQLHPSDMLKALSYPMVK